MFWGYSTLDILISISRLLQLIWRIFNSGEVDLYRFRHILASDKLNRGKIIFLRENQFKSNAILFFSRKTIYSDVIHRCLSLDIPFWSVLILTWVDSGNKLALSVLSLVVRLTKFTMVYQDTFYGSKEDKDKLSDYGDTCENMLLL